MENNNKNAAATQIPEGESFLIVRLNVKTGEFACVHSNIFDALALHELAGTALEIEKKKMLGAIAQPPQIAVPGLHLPTLDALRKKQS